MINAPQLLADLTRLLKRFERQGWVRTGRERVDILDAAALRALAAGSR